MSFKSLHVPCLKATTLEEQDEKASQQNKVITKENQITKDNNSIDENKTRDSRDSSSITVNLVNNCTTTKDGEENVDRNNIENQVTHYVCPICDSVLFSSHDFTIHLRSHKHQSPDELECQICGMTLSSTSLLDRHMLAHSTSCSGANLHQAENGYESDNSSDSLGSPPTLPVLNLKRRVSRSASEFNNNIIGLTPPSAPSAAKRKFDSDEAVTGRKKRYDGKKSFVERFDCQLCDNSDFLSSNLLETHIEECHPDYKAKCEPCNLVFKNHRVLNLHRYMVHHAEVKEHCNANTKQETFGFKDLTFVDFSSDKFPHIARVMCEQSLHHASSLYHRFQCEKCGRAFPCGSALNIHRQGCGNESYASSGESCHQDNDLSSSDNETPTDLSSSGKRTSWGENKVSESSEDVEDERRRYNFFACLDLQNKSLPNTPSQEQAHVKDKFIRDPFFNQGNTEGKDLADIQSIISVTSAGGLLHDLSKSPQPTVLEVTPPDSGSRNGVLDSSVTDEEQQDCFAAEFRKMKLRGEFPCRLCTAIFPNLRALKGHNRVHLSSNNGHNSAPYRCNMCPHFSSDKSALIRHMRTHNGDRPYECALCHYAFTTKANCERHLRNRHAKMTREDIKKSIIYHPSEDPTNEVEHKPISRDDVKRSLFCEAELPRYAETKERLKPEKIQNFVKSVVVNNYNVFNVIHSKKALTLSHAHHITGGLDASNNDKEQRKCLDVGTMTYEETESNQAYPKTVASPIKLEGEFERDVPLDLSMDVLDLSKKKSNQSNTETFQVNDDSNDNDEAQPQDLSRKQNQTSVKGLFPLSVETIEKAKITLPSNHTKEVNVSTPSLDTSDRENSMSPKPVSIPKIDISKLYPPNNHPFYINNAVAFPPFCPPPTLATGPYPPYFIPPPPPVLFSANPNHEFAEMKERLQKELIRGLQLTSGGSLVFDQVAMANAADRIQALHQQAMAEMNWRIENTNEDRNVFSPSLSKDSKPSVTNQNEPETRSQETNKQIILEKQSSKSRQDASSSSIKMVIKNGVLIPKQKQRRYRTERPFSCEHCSARFTLRSNMERHIKQQHPQFWSQRQRNPGVLPAKRNHTLPPKVPQATLLNHGQFYPPSGVPVSLLNITPEDDMAGSSTSNEPPGTEGKFSNCVEVRSGISEEVKNAIAQQLKSKLPHCCSTMNEDDNEDDDLIDEEDEDLVIDEEAKDGDTNSFTNDNRDQEEEFKKKVLQREENLDLASVSRLLDNASTQTFRQYFHSDEDHGGGENSEEDEEGLVAAGSASEGCNSGSDENRSESEVNSCGNPAVAKKKSAYSLAPNRVSCPYCYRKFPWSSSLRRHVLTHTGQKPYKCSHCPLLFTTKSNCDRHLLRKHGGGNATSTAMSDSPSNAAAAAEASAGQSNTPNYTMRNVPERPYKCKSCPSSTFSTLGNLKKHLSSKHQMSISSKSDGTQSGYESQGSASEEIDVGENEPFKNDPKNRIVTDPREIHPGHSSESTSTLFFKTLPIPVEQEFVVTQPSDLPFKCHLCEGSFGERQEALDHIRANHAAEFQLLVSKGALDVGNSVEENQVPDDGGEENMEQIRGKFPDYANRKVMCAFCMRRFWSAEDLRRHMRTHTGERPFSCDICRRRFTLKHSMLRHRKKHAFAHSLSSATEETSPASDEENGPHTSSTNHNNNNVPAAAGKPWLNKRQEEESDLISNLLGIQDKTIVEKMLISKSAEDAAKLLGVQK